MVKKAIKETHGIIKQQGEDTKSFIPIMQKHLEFMKEFQNKMEIMGNKMGVMKNEMEVMQNEINKMKILCEYRDWIRNYIIIVKREVKFNNEELDCITDYWEKEQEDEEQEDEEQKEEKQEDEKQEDEKQEDEKVDKRQKDEKEKNNVTMKLKKLEVFLQNDSLTLSEFMKLFRVREESNNTLHRDVRNLRKEKDKLKDGNFSKDLEQIKESLDKILDAILIQVKQ
ncbi:hypothetical protein RhiirA5_433078 [Rhizophagus irregularis]|uniref:Uncharacterized protein n=1 Tax=Rhizophagus irregularis TaxID=588596 RepID=A0A2N0NSE1_9GLOM|nr:hypothetical protein RhiirA5_433078 [Rhizophagus irregularis]